MTLIPRNLTPKNILRTISQFPSLFENIESFPLLSDDSNLTISEDDQNVYVAAGMPGLKKEDIDVSIENGILFISGEKKEEEKNQKLKFHRKAVESFSYRVAVPSQVDDSKIEASYEDGQLKVTLPKNQKAQSKRINIKSK